MGARFQNMLNVEQVFGLGTFSRNLGGIVWNLGGKTRN